MDKAFSLFGKFVLIAVIIGGVAYGAYRLGNSTASQTPSGAVSVTGAPTPTIDIGLMPEKLPENYNKSPQKVSAGLGPDSGLSFTMYTITLADGWTPNRTTTDEGTWTDTLTITKGPASIKIFQAATGGAMCLYPNDPAFEGPSSNFDSFVEITTTDNIHFRRGNAKGSQTFTICAKGNESYGQPTSFGHISYKGVETTDLVTLTQMDAMIASLKKQ